MRNEQILDLADCTEFRQTLLARPPRIAPGTVALLALLLGAALVWAALTRADLVVRAAGRVRPVTAPVKVFNAGRGEALSASTGGRVIEVNCREGDEVRRGDVLVRLDTGRLDNDIARRKQAIQAGQLHAGGRDLALLGGPLQGQLFLLDGVVLLRQRQRLTADGHPALFDRHAGLLHSLLRFADLA